MPKHSFLPTTSDVLRSMVDGILESYENPWDVLAELAQNSIDAIRKSGVVKGHLDVEIDQKKRKILWTDNGCGIDPSDIEDLFVIYGTNKRGDPDTIGEKGVGIKFVIFSSCKFQLVSHHAKGSFRLRVKDAANWVNDTDIADIDFETIEISNPDGLSGVEISLTLDDPEDPILDLSIEQLENLLKIKTAVGGTGHIWDENHNCDVTLLVKSSTGKTSTSNFDCRYALPTAAAKKKISIEAFQEWAGDGLKSDEQKRKKLKDALIYNSGSQVQGNREIRYWSCMAPTRKHWGNFAAESGLIDPEDADDANAEDHFFVQFGEVNLSTKFMPTGVTIELRPLGEAGYAENFFIIIEDEGLTFDIGRKGVPHRTAGVLRKIAQSEFRKYLGFKRFLRGEATVNHSQFEREKLFEEIKSLPDLKSDGSRFIKRPNGQEATVVALFYELIGKGEFQGFKPYISGYRDKYDLTGTFKNRNLVVEFKFDLNGLFSDFSSARKMFDEINVLIVWEITEGDLKKAKDRNIEVEVIDDDDQDRIFPRSDTSLSIDSVAPIEIVQLKKLLAKI